MCSHMAFKHTQRTLFPWPTLYNRRCTRLPTPSEQNILRFLSLQKQPQIPIPNFRLQNQVPHPCQDLGNDFRDGASQSLRSVSCHSQPADSKVTLAIYVPNSAFCSLGRACDLEYNTQASQRLSRFDHQNTSASHQIRKGTGVQAIPEKPTVELPLQNPTHRALGPRYTQGRNDRRERKHHETHKSAEGSDAS